MREGERRLGSLRARDDYPHLLRLLDDGEEFIDIDLADRRQELKTETAPDHRGGHQHAHFVLVEPRHTTAEDQPHIFRYVVLGDFDVRAKLAGFIEDLALFIQMPVNLFDEKWKSLALLEKKTHEAFGNLPLTQPMQHLSDGVLG